LWSLDEHRVRPHLGNPTVRGVWFPAPIARLKESARATVDAHDCVGRFCHGGCY
jgi:hypothetical protein